MSEPEDDEGEAEEENSPDPYDNPIAPGRGQQLVLSTRCHSSGQAG